jgi:hypothetical protein
MYEHSSFLCDSYVLMLLLCVYTAWTSSAYHNDTLLRHFNITSHNESSPNYDVGLAVSVSSMGVISTQRIYRMLQKVCERDCFDCVNMLI